MADRHAHERRLTRSIRLNNGTRLGRCNLHQRLRLRAVATAKLAYLSPQRPTSDRDGARTAQSRRCKVSMKKPAVWSYISRDVSSFAHANGFRTARVGRVFIRTRRRHCHSWEVFYYYYPSPTTHCRHEYHTCVRDRLNTKSCDAVPMCCCFIIIFFSRLVIRAVRPTAAVAISCRVYWAITVRQHRILRRHHCHRPSVVSLHRIRNKTRARRFPLYRYYSSSSIKRYCAQSVIYSTHTLERR